MAYIYCFSFAAPPSAFSVTTLFVVTPEFISLTKTIVSECNFRYRQGINTDCDKSILRHWRWCETRDGLDLVGHSCRLSVQIVLLFSLINHEVQRLKAANKRRVQTHYACDWVEFTAILKPGFHYPSVAGYWNRSPVNSGSGNRALEFQWSIQWRHESHNIYIHWQVTERIERKQ